MDVSKTRTLVLCEGLGGFSPEIRIQHEGVTVVGGLAQGLSINRPHHRGGTQDTDFNKGFTRGMFTKTFGEYFGGGQGNPEGS